jgi:hypothetical protein
VSKIKTFTLSTETVMKMGNKRVLIKSDGLDLSCFSENPLMLADHDWTTGGIIGKWENVKIEGGKLLANAKFSTKKLKAIELKDLSDDDFLNAVSIGGTPLECHLETIDGEEVLVCTKFLVLEASLCAVPMNKGCIAFYNQYYQPIEAWTFSDFITPNIDKTTPDTDMDFERFALAMGLPKTATEAEIMAKMSEATAAATNLAAFQKAQKDNQRAEMVGILDKAVADNRLDATLKDGYLTLSETNFDLVKKTIEALQAPVKLSDMTRQPVAGVSTAVAGQESWTFSMHMERGTIMNLTKEQRDALYLAEFKVKPEDDISPVAK